MSSWCHRFDQKSNENIVRISALKGFIASLGIPGSSMILLTIVPRKPSGSYKKFQGRNPYNIFFAILVETMTPKRHFKINWPLEVQTVLTIKHNDKGVISLAP